MTGEHLARHVAEAADAWLRDPQDADVYRRLVHATLAWRARTHLSSPGPGDDRGQPEAEGMDEVAQGPEPVALSDTVQRVLDDLRRRAVPTEAGDADDADDADDGTGTSHGEQ